MSSDHQLQKAVLDQLDFDPSINSSHIGVTARDGIVTLSGHVPSFGEKRAAETTAGRVKGVKVIIDQLDVEIPTHRQTTDEEIAERAYARLASNLSVPLDRIKLAVEKGVVTLRGDVAWNYQRLAAEEDLHKLDSIRDINNDIVIKSPVEPEKVHEKIHEALARIAPIEADNIEVSAEGGRVTLSGTVNTWHERSLVESAAWTVPGVTEVVDNIRVV